MCLPYAQKTGHVYKVYNAMLSGSLAYTKEWLMQEIIRQRVQEITDIALEDIRVQERKRLEYQSNILYDVTFTDNHWIAKEFVKVDEFEYSPKREYDALKLLEYLDVAPVAIDYLPYLDYEHPIVMYEYMQGEMWDRRKPSQTELKSLAETWLITHQATRPNLWLSRGWDVSFDEKLKLHHCFYSIYLEWAENHFADGIPYVQEALTYYQSQNAIIQNLRESRPTLLFSRSDPRFANIIARPNGKIGFVDWEDSGLRSPARTIADLLTHPNQEDLLTDSEWEIFIQTYCDGYPTDDNVRDLIHWDILLRSLTWFGGLLHFGVRRANEGKLEGWKINGMPANQRLRRYLARIKSWGKGSSQAELDNLQGVCFFPED